MQSKLIVMMEVVKGPTWCLGAITQELANRSGQPEYLCDKYAHEVVSEFQRNCCDDGYEWLHWSAHRGAIYAECKEFYECVEREACEVAGQKPWRLLEQIAYRQREALVEVARRIKVAALSKETENPFDTVKFQVATKSSQDQEFQIRETFFVSEISRKNLLGVALHVCSAYDKFRFGLRGVAAADEVCVKLAYNGDVYDAYEACYLIGTTWQNVYPSVEDPEIPIITNIVDLIDLIKAEPWNRQTAPKQWPALVQSMAGAVTAP